jgi:RHS repeat-associated protein
LSLAEERNGSDTVTEQFFSWGEMQKSNPLYFTRDHLGSIRDVTNTAGTLEAHYDYDPYGRRSVTSGTDLIEFGFTGHYYHAPSALTLAPYRVYSADLGRWLSRDRDLSIQSIYFSNRFGYANNQPSLLIDRLGFRSLLSRLNQGFTGTTEISGGLATALTAPAWGPFAPLPALTGAISMQVGMMNAIAAFAPDSLDDATADAMIGAPSSAPQAVARLFGGSEAQNAVSMVEPFIDGASLISNGSDSVPEYLNLLGEFINMPDATDLSLAPFDPCLYQTFSNPN